MKADINYSIKRFAFRIISNIISKTCLLSSKKRGDIYRLLGMKIGAKTFIGQNVYFDELNVKGISIGDKCIITRGCVFLSHFIDSETGVFILGEVTIGVKTFIGLNTIITKPVTIGNNVIIGAGSIVTKDIPDNCIAAGNPCRVIKQR